MTEQTVMLVNFLITCAVVLALQLLMPKLSRKDLFFGVRIPPDAKDSGMLKEIGKSYVKKNAGLGSAVILVVMIVALLTGNAEVFPWGTILFLLATFSVYYTTHEKVKKVKESQGWMAQKKQVVVVDTDALKEKGTKALVSPWWFLVPIAIIIANIAMGYLFYDSLPPVIATHWNGAGQVDEWMNKSTKIIYVMPKIQSVMLIVMFISYKVMGWAKIQMNVNEPEASRLQGRKFRRVWSGMIIVIAVVVLLDMTFGNLCILQVIKVNGALMIAIPMIFSLITMVGALYVSIKYGQSGSRYEVAGAKSQEGLCGRNDDKYWKLGAFYYNKDDPSMFVEKRFGIGVTINFGNTKAVLGFVVLIGFIIAMSVFAGH